MSLPRDESEFKSSNIQSSLASIASTHTQAVFADGRVGKTYALSSESVRQSLVLPSLGVVECFLQNLDIGFLKLIHNIAYLAEHRSVLWRLKSL